MNYNSSQIQDIIAWCNEGISYQEIANRIGTSKTSISRCIKNLRNQGLISPSSVTPQMVVKDQLENILVWYNQGLSYKEIAQKLDISESKVQDRITSLRRKGCITKLRHPKTPQNILDYQYDKISLWYSQGINRATMAQRLGISVYDVNNRIDALRKKGIITSYNKHGKKESNIDRILALEKNISKNGYIESDVHALLNLYIEEELYKDAIVLLDAYTSSNILSKNSLLLISQIRSMLGAKILEKFDNER